MSRYDWGGAHESTNVEPFTNIRQELAGHSVGLRWHPISQAVAVAHTRWVSVMLILGNLPGFSVYRTLRLRKDVNFKH